MRKRHFLTILIALPILTVGALTACENDDEMTGLEEAEAAALAQADGEGPERHLARLQEELDLTDDQVTRLRAIFEEQHAKFEALRENAPEDPEARHEAFHALWEETHESVSAVLTEEQRQRLEELRESRDGFHGGFHGAWDPERHLTRLQEELDLNAEQVTQLRTIFEAQRAKFQALKESAPEDREARREAFRKLWAETHESVNQVLTEEQQARLEELRRSHMGSHGPGFHGPRGDWHRES